VSPFKTKEKKLYEPRAEFLGETLVTPPDVKGKCYNPIRQFGGHYIKTNEAVKAMYSAVAEPLFGFNPGPSLISLSLYLVPAKYRKTDSCRSHLIVLESDTRPLRCLSQPSCLDC